MDSKDSTATEPLTDVELAELVAADRDLIPGPWVVWDDGDIGTAYSVDVPRRNRSTGEISIQTVESKHIFNGYGEVSDPVVTMRNSLPGLLARLQNAEAKVAELQSELELNRPPF